jgi:hypothetical protein
LFILAITMCQALYVLNYSFIPHIILIRQGVFSPFSDEVTKILVTSSGTKLESD